MELRLEILECLDPELVNRLYFLLAFFDLYISVINDFLAYLVPDCFEKCFSSCLVLKMKLSISLDDHYTYPEPKELIADFPNNQLMISEILIDSLAGFPLQSDHIQVSAVENHLEGLS